MLLAHIRVLFDSIERNFIVIMTISAVITIGVAMMYDPDTVTNVDEAVCIEKQLRNDGSVIFKFKRNRDTKEFQYTIDGTETNKKVFNELNNRIKKGTTCEIETDDSDKVRHVSVSIDD